MPQGEYRRLSQVLRAALLPDNGFQKPSAMLQKRRIHLRLACSANDPAQQHK